MTDHPILFSARMIRALLEGTKTQTRRIVKAQGRLREGLDDLGRPGVEYLNEWGSWQPWVPNAKTLRCPYGMPGDHLWVRETFAVPPGSEVRTDVAYRADLSPDQLREESEARKAAPRLASEHPWKPAIHMPRWASRITLHVTDVRVERLRAISESDAVAEGIRFDGNWFDGATHPIKGTPKAMPSAVQAFESLWDEINEKRAPWSTNPWVWVVAFRLADGLGGCDTCDVQTPAKAGT